MMAKYKQNLGVKEVLIEPFTSYKPIFKQLTLFGVKNHLDKPYVIILDYFALQEAATISNTT